VILKTKAEADKFLKDNAHHFSKWPKGYVFPIDDETWVVLWSNSPIHVSYSYLWRAYVEGMSDTDMKGSSPQEVIQKLQERISIKIRTLQSLQEKIKL